MLRPSLNEIVKKIDNRYFLIATVAKRARELVDHDKPLIKADPTDKPVVVASEEIIAGKIHYRLLTDEEIKEKELEHRLEQERKLLEQE